MSDAAGIRRPATLVRCAAADQEKNNGGQLAGTDGSASSAFERFARRCTRGHEGVFGDCASGVGAQGAGHQDQGTGRARHFRGDPLRRLHRLPRQGGTRPGRHPRRGAGDAGDGDLSRRRPSVMYASHAVAALAQFEAVKRGQVS